MGRQVQTATPAQQRKAASGRASTQRPPDPLADGGLTDPLVSPIQVRTALRKVPADAERWRAGLDRISQDSAKRHILRWQHAWDLLSDKHDYPANDADPNPISSGAWEFVKTMMLETLWYGTEEAYGRARKRVHRKWGQTIEVTYVVLEDGVRVSDGWVVTNRDESNR